MAAQVGGSLRPRSSSDARANSKRPEVYGEDQNHVSSTRKHGRIPVKPGSQRLMYLTTLKKKQTCKNIFAKNYKKKRKKNGK